MVHYPGCSRLRMSKIGLECMGLRSMMELISLRVAYLRYYQILQGKILALHVGIKKC